jgi:hypothetical protein
VRATLATTVAAMMLTGCTVEPAPSSPGLSRPTVAATTPSADERRSAAATEQRLTLPNLCGRPGQLVPGGLARVNRDTVTHTGPGPHYDPTGAAVAVVNPDQKVLPEPYRVLAGDRVVVDDGPLRIGDMDWFLVYSAEVRGEVSVGATVPTSASWVPARDGEGSLFEPLDGSTHCLFLAAGGPGRAALEVPPDQCSSGGLCPAGALAWVATAPPGESCRLVMTDRDSREVVIDADVSDWSTGASWWRDRESRLFVDTDCIWSVRIAEA